MALLAGLLLCGRQISEGAGQAGSPTVENFLFNAQDRPPPQGYPWPKTTVYGVTPIVFLSVESSEQQVGTSRANRAEAAVVADAARQLLPNLPPGELAIITPYAAQANELRTQIGRAHV